MMGTNKNPPRLAYNLEIGTDKLALIMMRRDDIKIIADNIELDLDPDVGQRNWNLATTAILQPKIEKLGTMQIGVTVHQQNQH